MTALNEKIAAKVEALAEEVNELIEQEEFNDAFEKLIERLSLFPSRVKNTKKRSGCMRHWVMCTS